MDYEEFLVTHAIYTSIDGMPPCESWEMKAVRFLYNKLIYFCMRIDTDLTEEDRKKVKDYADKRGLKLRRVYTDLLKRD